MSPYQTKTGFGGPVGAIGEQFFGATEVPQGLPEVEAWGLPEVISFDREKCWTVTFFC